MPVAAFNLTAPTSTALETEFSLPAPMKQFIIVVDGAAAVRCAFGDNPVNTGVPTVASGATLELLYLEERKFKLLSSGAASAVRIWAVY